MAPKTSAGLAQRCLTLPAQVQEWSMEKWRDGDRENVPFLDGSRLTVVGMS